MIRLRGTLGMGKNKFLLYRPPVVIPGDSLLISNLAINEAASPNEITLTTNGPGNLYWVVTSSATTPSSAQIIAGQTHTGVAAEASGVEAIVLGVNVELPNFSTIAAGTWYLHCVLDDGVNKSNTLTSASFDIAAAFTPAWQQFPGTAWLEKNSNLTGGPTNSAGTLIAITYSPSATDIGQPRELLIALSSANRLASLAKGSTNGIEFITENSSDVQTWNATTSSPTPMVSGGKYLILASVSPAGFGAKVRVFRLDTGGGQILAANDTDTGSLGGPSSLGWVIGAASGTGTRATSGQIERVQFWANTFADVNDAAVQGYFHEAGALKDPAVAIAGIGVTPHISIVGAALQTGTNAGSGGNFTKDGAGSIVPV